MPPWLESGRARSVDWDLRCARHLHGGARHAPLQQLMRWCSRLADGPLWLLSLLLLLWLGDAVAGQVARAALALGCANLAIYWALKRATRRQRPFRSCLDIRACIEPSDHFSFPSGHALHAVSFALLLGQQYPGWAPALWAFAALVAASRVVLGVHYPSDVLAGAAVGATTALAASSLL